MSGAGYRDPLTGLRERVRERRAHVDALAGRIGWALWASAPLATRERLDALRRSVVAPSKEDAARLTALESALDESIALLAGILAAGPDVALALDMECARSPELDQVQPKAYPRSRLELDDVGLESDLAPLVRRWTEVDPGLTRELGEDGVLRLRLRSNEVVLVFAALKEFDPFYRGRPIHLALAVSVPQIVPPIDLVETTTIGALGIRMGVLLDQTTGDPDFDAAFRVSMPAHAAPLFDADVRRALLGLRGTRDLELRVRSGVAALRWIGEPSAAALDLPVEVLLALRAAAMIVTR